MGKLRKLERSAVKAKAAKENTDFASAWSEYREKKYIVKDEDGNIIANYTPRNTQKKKQNHYDDKRQYFRLFDFLDGMNKASKEETAEAVGTN